MNSHSLRKVHIVGTGSFLPGPPVTVDEIASRLGRLDQAPTAVQNFDSGPGPRMAHESGVRLRHFAIDPETGDLTHDFASLAAEACRRALDQGESDPDEVDLLVVAAPAIDQTTPPTSAWLQAELGIERCNEIGIHSNCSGVGKAIQVALDAIRVGRCKTALVAYSQLSSLFLRSAWFVQPSMTRSQSLMRWILSDGSAALLLRGVDDPETPGHELVDAHAGSIGGLLSPAMTAGACARDVRLHRRSPLQLVEQGFHHLDQDFTAVTRFAAPRLEEMLLQWQEQTKLDSSDIDHFVLSTPTRQLYDDARARIDSIPWERAPFRCAESGYCGGAEILVQFDRSARAGEFRPGDLIVCYSVESSKWMGGGFLVRW